VTTKGHVLALHSRPVAGDPISGHLRFQVEDQLDLGQGDPELAQRRYEAGRFDLIGPVEPIAGTGVDPGRREQAHLVIEPQGLG
jgi:hypothetical protein